MDWMPFACKKLNRAALSCKARILPVRVSGRVELLLGLPQVDHAGSAGVSGFSASAFDQLIKAGNAGLDFLEQLVVGGDLPVDFSLVGADTALFHLAGRWPQVDRGDFINALPLVAAVVNAPRSTGRFQRPVGVGCPRCPPNLHISFIVPVGRILSVIFPAAFPIRDTLSVLVQVVCLAALCAPLRHFLSGAGRVSMI